MEDIFQSFLSIFLINTFIHSIVIKLLYNYIECILFSNKINKDEKNENK